MEASLSEETNSPPTEAQPKSEIPSSVPTPEGWKPARIFLCATLVSLLISFSSVYLYDRFIAQKVVAVDLQGFLAKQKELYLRGDINDTELKHRMDHLENFMETIPKRYAVLLGDVVVRNIEVVEP